jgi:hypothetical protein
LFTIIIPGINASEPLFIYQNGEPVEAPDFTVLPVEDPESVAPSNNFLPSGRLNYSSQDNNISFVLDLFNSREFQTVATPAITQVRKLKQSPNTFIEIEDEDFTITSASENSSLKKYVVYTTNGVEYNSVQSKDLIPIENYWIKDADDPLAPIRNVPSTISAADGTVVLTNEQGAPIGFPDLSSIRNAPQDLSISFGSIELVWMGDTVPPYGLKWSFYNIETKEFYGNTLSYADYINPETGGPNAVYVGLVAYDMDGDESTGNIISRDPIQISVDNLPNKIIAPLYSIKIKSKSKIGVYPPPSNLSKFDSWFIEVGIGKFFKKINVPKYNYSNFLKNHVGNELRCLYNTEFLNSSSSIVFGSRYYDVFDEHPLIISDNQIRTRHGSIHSYQDQIFKVGFNSKYTEANPIVPWLTVKIKNDQTGLWESIDTTSLVLDFNKHTGDVVFKKEIVPSNPFNIKISYTVKSPNGILRHVNGEEIPINPFSTSEKLIETPTFIYILPESVEYYDNASYVEENEYSVSSKVNWTKDYSIFDSSKENYNPLALHIGTVNVLSKQSFDNLNFNDLRVRGGGISGSQDVKTISQENKAVLSFFDVVSGKGYVYPNGGYVIVKIPKEVKQYFTSEEEIYSIVRSNLTAGISFDIQDLEGNDWRTI